MKVRGFPLLVLLALLPVAACNRRPALDAAPSDPQIAGAVQARLHSENALAGENIQVVVAKGMVTLSGAAADAASRALAGNVAGSVAGVRTVVNNLVVTTAPPSPAQTAAVSPQPRAQSPHVRQPRHAPSPLAPEELASAEIGAAPPPPNVPPPAAVPPAPAVPTPAPAPAAAAPLPPAAPEVRTITLPVGTLIPVRVVEDLSSADATPDMGFHATLAEDIDIGNMIAIPQGTPVLGRVVDARDAAHFRGSSLLSLEITRIDLPGNHLPIVTDTYDKQGAARGKDAGEKIGGGAVLGTLIGALAGGGKGAAVGALAGAGAGTAVNGATRGQQVEIPSETLISFSLQSPVTVTAERPVGTPPPANLPRDQPALQPALQQRPPQ